MKTTSEETLKNVDTTLGLMQTYDELGTLPISSYTEYKIFRKPQVAEREFIEVVVDLKSEIGRVPFNEVILNKKVPEIHVAFARNIIKYMRGQGLVEEEGHNDRVRFI